MTYPSFSAGEVLRAADMNAVGMWKVASTTFNGAGFSINNCFTSDFLNYRVVISGICTSANADTEFAFRASGSNIGAGTYAFASMGYYNGAVNNGGAGGGANGVGLIGFGQNRLSSITIDVFSPATSSSWKTVNVNNSFNHTGVGVIVRNIAGVMNSATSADGMSIVSANTIQGTCTVYGYRN
jgi:hypothetical protein